MLKKLPFFLGLLFYICSGNIGAQNEWIHSVGSTANDEPQDVCKDNNGDFILVGYFSDVMNLNTITLASTSVGIADGFIYKTDRLGLIQWAIPFGGYGVDKVIAVTTDNQNNIYVTGTYQGTATFGSFSLSSVNNTEDIFIAQLSPLGNFMWVKSAGGNMPDRPNDITLDKNKNVLITGQFSGNSTFGSATLNSMTDPNTGMPSIDVFTCKLSNSGNFIWTKQGSAKYSDKGKALCTDNNNNVYVCGQFSDTITFNQVHNNYIFNSLFFVKYDSLGNEVWFKNASGFYSMPNDIVIDQQQNIYMTGDFQNSLTFYNVPGNVTTGGNYSYKYFLAKFNTSGNLQWIKQQASSSKVSSKKIALDANNNPYIFGEFQCRFNDFANIHGQGTFCSVGYEDLFIAKYHYSGARLWERNWGGPKSDKAYGIAIDSIDSPVLASAFNKAVAYHRKYNGNDYLNENTILYLTGGCYLTNYPKCNDSLFYFYPEYISTESRGGSDMLLGRYMNENTYPYTYFNYRNDISCNFPFIGSSIVSQGVNPDNTYYDSPYDTLTLCEGIINCHHRSANNCEGELAPIYKHLWSTSDTTDGIHVTTDGLYSVIATTEDGCFSSTDSVYIHLKTPLPILISDEFGINVLDSGLVDPVIKCADSIKIWANPVPGETLYWSWGAGFVSANDTLMAHSESIYTVLYVDTAGCHYTSTIDVRPYKPLNLVLKSGIPDTISACYGNYCYLFVYDSLSNPTGSMDSAKVFLNLSSNWTSSPTVSITPIATLLSGSFLAYNAGTYIVDEQVIWSNFCGADTFYVKDTFYLKINPVPEADFTLSGNSIICPGDSQIVTLTINSIVPFNSNTILTIYPNDTIIVHSPGYYGFGVSVIDTVTGCRTDYDRSFSIDPYTLPYITSNPASGIICPNSTATLSCVLNGAQAYQWYGPNGLLTGQNNNTVIVNTPGHYYCIAVNSSGCRLGSNVLDIEQYNSPYILAIPDNHICPDENTVLNVIANDSAQINWLGSLSGYTSPTVSVSQAGTYSCSSTLCGITNISSVLVSASNPIAQVSVNGSLSICPGDSVQLTANSGMASYYWDPTNNCYQSFWTYQPGIYILTTTDIYGCNATSNPVTVSFNSTVSSPVITTSGYTVCAGDSSLLSASGTGPIKWYLQQYGGNAVYTGNVLNTHALFNNVTYYVAVEGTGACQSIRLPIMVSVTPSSIAPDIVADTVYCTGQTIQLGTTVTNVSYHWAGPNNFSSSVQNPSISNCSYLHSGTYSLIVNDAQCNSPQSTIHITVIDPPKPVINPLYTFCSGSSVLIQPSSPDNYNWYGPNGLNTTGNSLNFNPILLSDSGNYHVFLNLNTCSSDTSNFQVAVIPTPTLNLTADTMLCENDSIHIAAVISGAVGVSWTTPQGAFTNNPLSFTNITTAFSGWYYASASINTCQSSDSIHISVYTKPLLNLRDTFTCSENEILLGAPNGYSFYHWSTGSSQAQIYASMPGIYTVSVSLNNSCYTVDSLMLNVIDCNAIIPNVFTPNNDGKNDFFVLGPTMYKEVHYLIYDRWGKLTFDQTNTTGWNGKNMENKEASDGVYFYICETLDVFGKSDKFSGYLHLFR